MWAIAFVKFTMNSTKAGSNGRRRERGWRDILINYYLFFIGGP
jgi:hypothetical protein